MQKKMGIHSYTGSNTPPQILLPENGAVYLLSMTPYAGGANSEQLFPHPFYPSQRIPKSGMINLALSLSNFPLLNTKSWNGYEITSAYSPVETIFDSEMKLMARNLTLKALLSPTSVVIYPGIFSVIWQRM